MDTAIKKVTGFPAKREVVLANRVNQDLGFVGLMAAPSALQRQIWVHESLF
jgi:hypothetical protein